jgi:hypothetical protein
MLRPYRNLQINENFIDGIVLDTNILIAAEFGYPLKAGQIRRDKKELRSFLSRFALLPNQPLRRAYVLTYTDSFLSSCLGR